MSTHDVVVPVAVTAVEEAGVSCPMLIKHVPTIRCVGEIEQK